MNKRTKKMKDRTVEDKVEYSNKLISKLGDKGYYLELANVAAMRSACNNIKRGAVLVYKDTVVGIGSKGVANCGLSDCTGLAECTEINKCIQAEESAVVGVHRDYTNGATLYISELVQSDEGYFYNTNIELNTINIKLIKLAGIVRVISLVDGYAMDLI